MKLKVKEICGDSHQLSILIEDEISKRSCWYDVWNINEDGYEMDFNCYIFDLTNSKDIELKQFQDELLEHSEDVSSLIDEIINSFTLIIREEK